MTTRYVGPGGNDGNTGLSWAQRKLTLNGVEDTPIVAGDYVWVGPGVYRETLTCDVSGTAGNVITYVGDYDGSHTDGVGGVVRITCSNDDMVAAARNYCIYANAKTHRTFSGFYCDNASTYGFYLNNACTNWTIQQCYCAGSYGVRAVGDGQASLAITNCYFSQRRGGSGVYLDHSSAVDNCGHVISNCIITGSADQSAINTFRIGGVTIKNCCLLQAAYGVLLNYALTAGQLVTVNNCNIWGCYTALRAATLGDLVEDYNNIFGAAISRTNVDVGAHSLAYPPLFDSRWFFEMVNGGSMVTPFDLSAWSQLINVAGTSPTAADMRETTVQGAEREWGALEFDTTLDIEAGTGGGGAVSISPWREGLLG